jgi:hypothetical protein
MVGKAELHLNMFCHFVTTFKGGLGRRIAARSAASRDAGENLEAAARASVADGAERNTGQRG